MEYLKDFNRIMDLLENNEFEDKLEATEFIRIQIKKTYENAFKEGFKSADGAKKEAYEEGRQVGYSLGYKEGFEAGKVNKKQRLMNSFGGR